ncbi:MAG: phosphatase PAP2 family protein [Oscillospiraceae bacterium]|jgi:undecaprenyl-diphosphatase|nr:phosphatase PAP2 family protein [Oscillospiraceae bacterium]
MKNNTKKLYIGLLLVALFVLWTALVVCVDVRAIGPEGSSVGFAAINGPFHKLTGEHMGLYKLTDWLGVVPFIFVFAFAILGLFQLIRRRSLLRVDASILILGAYYIVVAIVYILFEFVVVNRRPVLIEGVLEPSYPSSTTMLVLCVVPTAMMQLGDRMKSGTARSVVLILLGAFAAFMVIGRLISGVHWLTDIIGGVIISAGLVTLYAWAVGLTKKKRR